MFRIVVRSKSYGALCVDNTTHPTVLVRKTGVSEGGDGFEVKKGQACKKLPFRRLVGEIHGIEGRRAIKCKGIEALSFAVIIYGNLVTVS